MMIAPDDYVRTPGARSVIDELACPAEFLRYVFCALDMPLKDCVGMSKLVM